MGKISTDSNIIKRQIEGEKKLKAEDRKRQRKILFLAGGIVCVAVLVAVLTLSGRKEKEPSDSSDELEAVMTIDLFPGFSGEDAGDVLEGELSNPKVLLEYAGSYDGVFYEDGDNQEKDDVFSLILTNIAEDTLEVMQLWIEDDEGETYQFQVSALPSGGTVLAQELEGKTFRKDAGYKVVRDNFGFLENDAELSILDIEEKDGKVYVTNNGQDPLDGVQIIYKNWLGGHAYSGGIAYRISMGEIQAGKTLEVTSEHYKDGESKVTGMKQVQKPEGGSDGESAD